MLMASRSESRGRREDAGKHVCPSSLATKSCTTWLSNSPRAQQKRNQNRLRFYILFESLFCPNNGEHLALKQDMSQAGG